MSGLGVRSRSLLMRLLGSNLASRRIQNTLRSKTQVLTINYRRDNLVGFLMFSTHHDRGVFENQPSSWLFVSDATAGAYGSQVNLNLDLPFQLAGEQLQKLLTNINRRKLDVNLEELLTEYAKLEEFERRRKEMQDKKREMREKLSHLRSQRQIEAEETIPEKDLRAALKSMKKEVAEIQQCLWPLEEKVMLSALKLPNVLHSTTPLEEDFIVIKEKKAERALDFQAQSHVEVGRKHDLITFSNVGPKAYYLCGEIAHAELSVSDTVVRSLQDQGYRLMAGPEFFKTPILEGCGRDVYDPKEVLTMEHISPMIEPMNHLAGISPMTFVAYLARTCVGDNSLPFRMVSCGRAYQSSQEGNLPGLCGAAQSTQVGVFTCTKESEVDSEFDAMFTTIWNHLEPLGFSLRACQLGASKLRREESRRVDFEMYLPGSGLYVPVAHLSDLGDYVSRRLMVSHNLNHGDYRQASLAHMVSGTVLNITSLLAVWMEHSDPAQDAFSLSSMPKVGNQEVEQ